MIKQFPVQAFEYKGESSVAHFESTNFNTNFEKAYGTITFKQGEKTVTTDVANITIIEVKHKLEH